MKDFCAEACVTSLVDSRHLLSCLGACLTGKDPFIVLSYYGMYLVLRKLLVLTFTLFHFRVSSGNA